MTSSAAAAAGRAHEQQSQGERARDRPTVHEVSSVVCSGLRVKTSRSRSRDGAGGCAKPVDERCISCAWSDHENLFRAGCSAKDRERDLCIDFRRRASLVRATATRKISATSRASHPTKIVTARRTSLRRIHRGPRLPDRGGRGHRGSLARLYRSRARGPDRADAVLRAPRRTRPRASCANG